VLQTNPVEEIKTHILCSGTFFENRTVLRYCGKIL